MVIVTYPIYLITIILTQGCGKENIDNTPFVESDSNGNIISGDTSLQYFKITGLDSVPDIAWTNYLGFVPKKGKLYKVKLSVSPNPLRKTEDPIVQFNSEIEIMHLFTTEENSFGLDRILNKKSFSKVLQQKGIEEKSKNYGFMVITIDSFVLFNSYYIKRI